jgi:hypothetical protein
MPERLGCFELPRQLLTYSTEISIIFGTCIRMLAVGSRVYMCSIMTIYEAMNHEAHTQVDISKLVFYLVT